MEISTYVWSQRSSVLNVQIWKHAVNMCADFLPCFCRAINPNHRHFEAIQSLRSCITTLKVRVELSGRRQVVVHAVQSDTEELHGEADSRCPNKRYLRPVFQTSPCRSLIVRQLLQTALRSVFVRCYKQLSVLCLSAATNSSPSCVPKSAVPRPNADFLSEVSASALFISLVAWWGWRSIGVATNNCSLLALILSFHVSKPVLVCSEISSLYLSRWLAVQTGDNKQRLAAYRIPILFSYIPKSPSALLSR
jgi:hypothetical protein